MSSLRFVSVVCCVLSSAITAVAAPPATEDRAVKAARLICASVGADTSGEVKAEFPSQLSQTPQAKRCWMVKFGEDVAVEVDDTTLLPGFFRNRKAGDDRGAQAPPPEMLISRANIVAQAAKIVALAGVAGELKLVSAEVESHHPSSRYWFVSYRRMFHGVPYRNQGANILLSPETGNVQVFSINFSTSAPVSFARSVSREQAFGIADNQLMAAGFDGVSRVSVQLYVIEPNAFWTASEGEVKQEGSSRVAWECVYRSDEGFVKAWIDAETGAVIGGEKGGYRGGSAFPRPQPKSTPKKTAPKTPSPRKPLPKRTSKGYGVP